MGMFDDLIPSNPRQREGVAPDAAPARGMFDDLIPSGNPLDDEARANLAAEQGNIRKANSKDEVFRGLVLPFLERGDGTQELAVPGIVHEPIAAAGRIIQGIVNPPKGAAPGYVPLTKDDPRASQAYIQDAMAASSPAVAGGRFVSPTAESAAAAAEINAFGPMLRPGARPGAPMGGAAIDELAAASERLGIDVPRSAALDGVSARQVAGGTAAVPVVGTPLVNSARQTIDAMGAKAKQIADDLGGATPQAAGQSVKDDVLGWIKEGSRAEAERIYDPATTIMGQPGVKQPLANLKSALDEISTGAAESRLPPPKIVELLEPAALDAAGLGYKGLQNLRTQIGDMMSGRVTPEPGMSNSALKRVYAALSSDLEDMAKTAGRTLVEGDFATAAGRKQVRDAMGVPRLTEPVKQAYLQGGAEVGELAWGAANTQFREKIASKRDALSKLVGATGDATPEAIVDRIVTYAGSKGGADIGRLQQVRSVLSKEAGAELESAVVSRMGWDKDGFSPAKFRTSYEGLSPAGKQLLFPDKTLRQSLDDIATISQRFEQLQKFGNPSGTARVGTLVAAAGAMFTHPLETIASAVGGYALARHLASPIKARDIAEFSRAYMEAATSKRTSSLARYEAAAKSLAASFANDDKPKGRR